MTRNGPVLWAALLDAVRPYTDKDVLIAGGCVRDYALSLEPKDIDIFVACSERGEVYELCDRLNEAGLFSLHMIERGDEDHEASTDAPDLIGCLDGEGLGVPVNIVCRADHQRGRMELLAGFDFHILRAFYDGLDDVHWMPEAIDDLGDRAATLDRDATPCVSEPRFAKFNKRNPGVLRMRYDLQPDLFDVFD